MRNQRGTAQVLLIILLATGILVYGFYLITKTNYSIPFVTQSHTSQNNSEWISGDSYQYQLLPNKTKVSKLLFTGPSYAEGENALDNITTHYLFGNSQYDPNGLGIYYQALYDKNDGVYTIKIGELMGRQTLFFSSTKLEINRMASLHLFDKDLLSHPEVEGVIVELDNNNILEFVHYGTPGTTAEDYAKDSPAFWQLIGSIK